MWGENKTMCLPWEAEVGKFRKLHICYLKPFGYREQNTVMSPESICLVLVFVTCFPQAGAVLGARRRRPLWGRR